jgi:hypothetical protein
MAMILLSAITGCTTTPTRLYEPAVAKKPRGDDGYRADLSDCKLYEAQSWLGIQVTYFGAGGLWGADAAQSASGDGIFDHPNDVVDDCMRARGYRVL